jgi:hypothetical protein
LEKIKGFIMDYIKLDEEIIENNMNLIDYLLINDDEFEKALWFVLNLFEAKKMLIFKKNDNDLGIEYYYIDISDDELNEYVDKFNILIERKIEDDKFKLMIKYDEEGFEILTKYCNIQNI